MLLLYQIPAKHTVDIGGYDAAYVRGFHDAHYANAPQGSKPYLQGSDGSARWSRAQSFLLFPQAGLPGTVTLRMRGWREHGTPPVVHIFLNGHTLLATLQTSTDWQTYSFAINGGLLKPHDVVLDIRSSTTTLPTLPSEEQNVGVLLDRATYTVAAHSHPFIIPYPAQVCYGTLAIGLWWLLYTHKKTTDDDKRLATVVRHIFPFALIVGVLFLACYRLQPPFYPYPLRWLLPGIDAVLLGVLILRHAPSRIAQHPASINVLVCIAAIAWSIAVFTSSHAHITLSVPGVEKDFRVFATRATSLDAVLQADGFYHLGYPFLLWLIHPLTHGNVFLAARVIATASGAVLLLSGAWLAYHLFKHIYNDTFYAASGAFLALLILAGSSLTVEYALYVGSDMPFAALTTLSLALFVWAMPPTTAGIEPPPKHQERQSKRSEGAMKRGVVRFLAGVAAGFAFLMRHPGLVLLPWGVLVCLLIVHAQHPRRFFRVVVCAAPFIAGCLLGAMPQLAVNMLDTGQLLYSQQAKNIWLAVYGNIDWNRWYEVPNTIGLAEIVLRDPVRFAANWWRNIVGFMGSGAEDTSEFGRAIQLRLLSWPANWLAIVGLVSWLIALTQRLIAFPSSPVRTRIGIEPPRRQEHQGVEKWAIPATLLLFLALYSAAICIGFILPRFFLPLMALYASAAAWVVQHIIFAAGASMDALHISRRWIIASTILLLFAYQGFTIGTRYVLTHQPEDERLVIALALNTLQPGEKVLVRAEPGVPLDRYSALAHAVAPWPNASHAQLALTQAREQGIAYVVWDDLTYGPPPLPNHQAARLGPPGQYGLYRLGQ